MCSVVQKSCMRLKYIRISCRVALPACGHFGLWPFRLVVVSVYGGFGLWPFLFVAVSICSRFGLWAFRFVAFQFVAVSVVAVSFCRRYDLLPIYQQSAICPGLNTLAVDIMELYVACKFYCYKSVYDMPLVYMYFLYMSFVTLHSCHSVKIPSMVDSRWNILHWESRWILNTVCWDAVGCECVTNSASFGITFVFFILRIRQVFVMGPKYYRLSFFLIYVRISFEGQKQNLQKIPCRFKTLLRFVGQILIKLPFWYHFGNNLCEHAGGHWVTTEAFTSFSTVCVVWRSGSSLALCIYPHCIPYMYLWSVIILWEVRKCMRAAMIWHLDIVYETCTQLVVACLMVLFLFIPMMCSCYLVTNIIKVCLTITELFIYLQKWIGINAQSMCTFHPGLCL